MIKLFAILTVLAALPVSALAEQVPLAKNAAIHCTAPVADSAYTAATGVASGAAAAAEAQIAR